MKKASEEEKQEINLLQEEFRGRLRVLKRAEHLQKKRKRKEQESTAFYWDSFKLKNFWPGKKRTA